MKRWSIYIDVEGFSAIFGKDSTRALNSLIALLKGVHDVASRLPNSSHDRLFVHQVGDGFVIVSDFPETTITRPLSIAIGLLQLLLISGGVGRAAISHGEFADITSCYPADIQKVRDGHYLQLPSGIMTIFPVMGDALTNAYKAQDNSFKGPCLFVDPCLLDCMEFEGLKFCHLTGDLVVIDWIGSSTRMLAEVRNLLSIESHSAEQLKVLLARYVSSNPVCDSWAANALLMAGGT